MYIYILYPWAAAPYRSRHHFLQRQQLEALCEQYGLEVNIPSTVLSVPGGPFADACATADPRSNNTKKRWTQNRVPTRSMYLMLL